MDDRNTPKRTYPQLVLGPAWAVAREAPAAKFEAASAVRDAEADLDGSSPAIPSACLAAAANAPQLRDETPQEQGLSEKAQAAGDFLADIAARGPLQGHFHRERRRVLGEIDALRAENRWQDILALFHPVEEKLPELVASGLAVPVRAELGFALSRLGRFDEAIAIYRTCVGADPDHFHYHAGLAYCAYNSLYAAKNRHVVLHPSERKTRIDLAHQHFARAQELRPEGVTNFYRQGMLYRKIQGKTDQAQLLFETAVRNWQAYSDELKGSRHQERKNYIKALFQLSSCLLECGQPSQALEHLEICLVEDGSSNHLSSLHKHFALGKVYFHLGRYRQAEQALQVAAAEADPSEDDYVFELLARTYLALDQPIEAQRSIERVPMARRRPYVRWTEADALVAQGNLEQAVQTLRQAVDRDRRGRHKGLLRLARLEFRRERYDESLRYAKEAHGFFQGTYQNQHHEALFWQAASLLRLGRRTEADQVVHELSVLQPHYPNLGKLKLILVSNIPDPENG